MSEPQHRPRGCIIAGTHSGCGKTTIALGLMAALVRRGHVVQPYKAGPDYIDPGHHASATGRPSINLDGWMCGKEGVRRAFARGLAVGGLPAMPATTALHDRLRNTPGNAPDSAHGGEPSVPAVARASTAPCGSPPVHAFAAQHAPPDIAIIEGVMGLFDGASSCSTEGSTAELSLVLDLPVVLVADMRGMARSAAALVRGYADLEPGLRIAGVIANRVGGEAHRAILREALAHSCPDIPLLGMIPRSESLETTSRHLGLALAGERDEAAFLASLVEVIEAHVDMDAFLAALPQVQDVAPAPPTLLAPPVPLAPPTSLAACSTTSSSPRTAPVRVAVARDEAFCFLYPENVALLVEAGIEPVFFSPLHDPALPHGAEGLILPGGYPELHADRLAANVSMRASIRDFAASGRPVVGECGGYMYLMEALETAEGTYAMCGCLPLRCRMDKRLRALGYREAVAASDLPYGAAGTVLRGHEYHYSHLVEPSPLPPAWHLCDRRGVSIGSEGCRHGAILGSYVHLHLASNPCAARAFAAACRTPEPA